MARPVNYRPPTDGGVELLDPPEGQAYERLEYFTEPEGMFATMQPQDAGPQVAIIAKNFLLNENGKLQIRRPMNRVFYDAAIIPIGQIGVVDPTGTGKLLLFHEAGIKYSLDGGSNWSDATGPALGAGAVLINYAMWAATTLLFTTTAGNKIYTFDTSTYIYSEIASTVTAQILTVFGGRAIVSAGATNTIYWSIKNDHTDFAGVGSGTESLRLSPGRASDDVIGMFPVNDTQMLVIRTGSVWLATVTGNVDVPFTFDFLYLVNLSSARSLAYSPYGIYAWGLEGTWLLTTSSPENIGEQIVGGWINSDTVVYNHYQAVGCYDAMRDIYFVYVPFTSADNAVNFLRFTDANTTATRRVTDSGEDRIADYPLTDPTLVLAYHRKRQRWTYLSLPTNLNSIASVNFRTPAIKGLIATSTTNQGYVEYQIDAIVPNDGDEEYDYSNTLVAVETQLLTGVIGGQSKSQISAIGKVEIDLMSGSITAQARRTNILLYQTRSGPRTTPGSAVTYCDKTGIVDSDGRNLEAVRSVKATKKFWQLDLRLSKCTTYTLLGVYIYVERGAEANQ